MLQHLSPSPPFLQLYTKHVITLMQQQFVAIYVVQHYFSEFHYFWVSCLRFLCRRVCVLSPPLCSTGLNHACTALASMSVMCIVLEFNLASKALKSSVLESTFLKYEHSIDTHHFLAYSLWSLLSLSTASITSSVLSSPAGQVWVKEEKGHKENKILFKHLSVLQHSSSSIP